MHHRAFAALMQGLHHGQRGQRIDEGSRAGPGVEACRQRQAGVGRNRSVLPIGAEPWWMHCNALADQRVRAIPRRNDQTGTLKPHVERNSDAS